MIQNRGGGVDCLKARSSLSIDEALLKGSDIGVQCDFCISTTSEVFGDNRRHSPLHTAPDVFYCQAIFEIICRHGVSAYSLPI